MMMSPAVLQKEKKRGVNKYEKICCAQTAVAMTSEVQIWMPCPKVQCEAKVLLLFPKCHKKADVRLRAIERNWSLVDITELNSRCETIQIGLISDTISYQIRTIKFQMQWRNRLQSNDEKKTWNFMRSTKRTSKLFNAKMEVLLITWSPQTG